MPPKKATGVKAPFQANKPVKSAPPLVKRGPIWLDMGLKKVAFIKCARELSALLCTEYGDGFSITKFESALLELKGNIALKDKIHLPDELINLHTTYCSAKREMIEEQRLLSSSFQTVPIEVDIITSKDELFASNPRPNTAVSRILPEPQNTERHGL
jgi:hypothetical protein